MLTRENLFAVLLAAVTAYYFGWLSGTKNAIAGVKPGEIVIDGQKYLIPSEVYNQIKGLITL
jgi:hypothetical protein